MRIHIDLAGVFPAIFFFIIIQGSCSKMINGIPMTNRTSSAVIDRLICTTSILEIPYFIVSDNGPSLVSQEINTFCKLNGIKHLMITTYHPCSKGGAKLSV